MKRAVSLILILSLILAIFAIPAQASAVGTGIIITASAASVISAALIGLGVMPGTDGSVFDGIVSDVVDYFSSIGIGDGVGIPILKYLGPGGGIQYALQSTVLQTLRSLLFGEGVLSSSTSIPVVTGSYISSGNPISISISADFPYTLVHFSYSFDSLGSISCNDKFVLYASNPSSTKFTANSRSYTLNKINDSKYYSVFFGTTAWNSSVPLVTSNLSFVDLGRVLSDNQAYSLIESYDFTSVSPSISSSFDLSLGDIAAPDTSLAVGYPNWAIDSVQVDPGGDDEDPVPFVPIGLGDTLEEIQSSSQSDVQSGSSTLETPNDGTEVNISGDVGGSLTPDGGGSGDLPSGDGAVTVDDLTTMFAWIAVRIDEAVQSLFPDLQVIKTYLKAIAQWHETENVKYDSMLSYFSGWDTDFDTMLTNLSNIDLNLTTLVDHAGSSVDLLSAIASDVQDIRDVIADPLDVDINEQEQDNKNAFLNTFSKKSQADNIGDLSGLSDGFTEWFSLDVDPSLLFDQMDTGFTDWFTSETAQAISVGGGAAAAGISLMDDAEYEDSETPYLDAWDQEVQNILSGGDGEW